MNSVKLPKNAPVAATGFRYRGRLDLRDPTNKEVCDGAFGVESATEFLSSLLFYEIHISVTGTLGISELGLDPSSKIDRRSELTYDRR